jgi:hypothetical protein
MIAAPESLIAARTGLDLKLFVYKFLNIEIMSKCYVKFVFNFSKEIKAALFFPCNQESCNELYNQYSTFLVSTTLIKKW